MNSGFIILPDTKNGEIRRLPLVGKAYELLKELESRKKNNDDYLFIKYDSTKPVDIQYEWKKALKQAGTKNFRFHDLRHSAASYLAMNGASQFEIAAILGHKSPTMSAKYAHLSPSHTTNVLSSMNKKIFGD